MADVQFGLLPSADLQGLALMSDGGAEKLVAHDGSRVAARMGAWFDELAQQMLSPEKIALAYHEPAMWERTTLDDRSIVLAARVPMPATLSSAVGYSASSLGGGNPIALKPS